MATQSLSATSVIRSKCKQFNPNKPSQNTLTPNKTLQSQWLSTISRSNLSLQSSNPRPFLRKRPRISATISFSLPTGYPDRVEGLEATEKFPKWSSTAIKSFAMAELEARKIKSPNTGTEALVMGILIEGTNFASTYLRAYGITLSKVRDEILKLFGEPDFFFYSPEHPPLTEAAQKALDWAVDEKLKSGGKGEITTTHILLGVWQQQESGYQLLTALGFNDERAKELESIISDPRFVGE